MEPLPKALVGEIKSRLAAVPDAYLRALAQVERTRLHLLLQRGNGTEQDLEYLRRRIQGAILPTLERDWAGIRLKAEELRGKALEAPATDVVYFKGGGRVEGVVEEEPAEYVKIRSRFGAVKRAKAAGLKTAPTT